MGEGHPDKAIPLLRQAVELRPEEPSLRHDLAVAYTRSGMNDDAIEMFEFLIKQDPENADYFSSLGSLYLRTDKLSPAAVALARSHELHPKSALVPITLPSATIGLRRRV